MIVLYTFVFGAVLQLRFTQNSDPITFGLYIYCGLIPYLAFSNGVEEAVSTIRKNNNLVQKVVFPIEILPLSEVAVGFISQLFSLGGLIIIFAFLKDEVHWTILLLPVVMVPQILFTFGIGYIVSALGTFIPDIKEIMSALLRALLFATPILWPASMIPEKYRVLVELNPFTFIVDAYRGLVLEGQIPNMSWLVWFTFFSAAVFVAGFTLFQYNKLKFADVL
jgi:ABC-type polysaccharide/polyol phosphate export permease